MKYLNKPPWLKAGLYAILAAGIVVLVCVPVYHFFPSDIINGYLEKRIVHACAGKYPTYELKISGFNFSLWKNRIACDSLVLAAADSGFTCAIGTASVSGIAWSRFLWGPREKVLSGAVAEARDIMVKLPGSDYGLSCKRLRVSMPAGEITADTAGFKPLVDDSKYYSKRKYRSTRYLLTIPACRITGLAVPELLDGMGYLAHSIQIDSPSLDALVHKYVPVAPVIVRSLMPNEMMNAIRKNVRIESLNILNGNLRYTEVYAPGAAPATVTFDNLQLRAEGIRNDGNPGETAVIRCQADFMQGGKVQAEVALPLSSPEFALKVSGSLSAMNLSKLNPFLEHSEYIHIGSGNLRETSFAMQVTDGHASGTVQAVYNKLNISMLDKETGSRKGIINVIGSLLMNELKIRSENVPEGKVALKTGKVDYARKPDNTFIQFLWFSLRTGILDVLFFK